MDNTYEQMQIKSIVDATNNALMNGVKLGREESSRKIVSLEGAIREILRICEEDEGEVRAKITAICIEALERKTG